MFFKIDFLKKIAIFTGIPVLEFLFNKIADLNFKKTSPVAVSDF